MFSKNEIHLKLAKNAREEGNPELSVKILEKIIKEDPENYQLALDLLSARVEQKNPPDVSLVAADVERALRIDSTQVEPYIIIVTFLYHINNPEVDTWVEKALSEYPDNTIFLSIAGTRAISTDVLKARFYFQMCIAHEPTCAEHHFSCGMTYIKERTNIRDREMKGMWHLKMAVSLKPEWLAAKRALVENYLIHAKYKEALEISSEDDVEIDTSHHECRWRIGKTTDIDYEDIICKVSGDKNRIGAMLKNQASYCEAQCDYTKSVMLFRNVYDNFEEYFGKDADSYIRTDIMIGLGQILCKIGNWDEGIQIYSNALDRLLKLEHPEWDGKKTGHLVILNGNLGYGDQMFYSRYINLAAALADKTTLVTRSDVKHLYDNLKTCKVTDEIPKKADAWIECSQLMKFFNLVPMLDLFDTKTSGPTGRALIHLNSSPNPLLQYRRDFPFSVCKDLVSDLKYTWVSVAKQAEEHPNITDLSETIDNCPESFKETIELLRTVDFVVTVDTSIAHLAGLMRRPTLLLLTTLSEFRWGIEDNSYEWYPTVKYWRQKVWGEWPSLTLQEVETILELNYSKNISDDSIPKIIHQTAPSDESKWNPIWKPCQESWKKHFPDYEYKMWTDEDLDNFIQTKYNWFWPTYSSYSRKIKKIDAARYFILYEYGGIYADMDFECLKNFEHLLPKGKVCAAQSPLYNPNDNTIEKYQNALMASPRFHKFWEWVWLDLEKHKSNPYIVAATGPWVIIRMADNHPDVFQALPKENFAQVYDDNFKNLGFVDDKSTHASQILLEAPSELYARHHGTFSWK
jgi:tetratricopeptide (TPR) repeat protein